MKHKWQTINKILLVGFASVVVAVALWYTNGLVADLQNEETKRMEHWADATKLLASSDMSEYEIIDYLLKIVHQNTTIPIIVTDGDDNILQVRNLAPNDSLLTTDEINKIFLRMKSEARMIDVPLEDGQSQRLYYSNSHIINRLSFFPLIQIALVAMFVIFAYVVFSRARRSEQDKVWIGLARETAHQLGTPITALIGWSDILEADETINRQMVAREMQNDISRLRSVADRFSKIGSYPEMQSAPIADAARKTVDYLRPRIPSRISIEVDDTQGNTLSPKHNATLIGWAMENLCRNAVDATEGEGRITISIVPDGKNTAIDITDSGKGMTKSAARHIFDAGYTTKQRGWGIGLTLARRIVKQYHRGRIFVRRTEPRHGTTIRIVLRGQ